MVCMNAHQFLGPLINVWNEYFESDTKRKITYKISFRIVFVFYCRMFVFTLAVRFSGTFSLSLHFNKKKRNAVCFVYAAMAGKLVNQFHLALSCQNVLQYRSMCQRNSIQSTRVFYSLFFNVFIIPTYTCSQWSLLVQLQFNYKTFLFTFIRHLPPPPHPPPH